MASDESLRARISNLFQRYQNQTIDETKAALIEELFLPLAAEKGFSFSLDEIHTKQYEIDMIKEPENGELSLERLDSVAGGLNLGFREPSNVINGIIYWPFPLR